MNLPTYLPILIAVAVLLAVGLIIWFAALRLRSMRLKRRYGQEYDYTLERTGDRRSAEANLQQREKRVTKLDLHELNDQARERYHTEWIDIQASFVENPAKSVANANRLITEVMIARGFPIADFEQRVSDLSVLYPDFASNYRQATAIISKSRDGGASTEELRQAMIDFHALFDQLTGTLHPAPAKLEPEKQLEHA